nr:hypothetical protein [Sphingomonas sediminicola]
MPGRKKRYTFRFREAGQLVGLAESHRWRLFHQYVEAACNALADNLVTRGGWRGDRDRFQSFDLLQQFAPVRKDGMDALPGTARRCGQLKPWIPGDRGTCWSAAILPKPMMAIRIGCISA